MSLKIMPFSIYIGLVCTHPPNSNNRRKELGIDIVVRCIAFFSTVRLNYFRWLILGCHINSKCSGIYSMFNC